MNDDPINLSSVNEIAYDPNLRVNLKTLHEMLGSEVTDIANSAMQFGFKFNTDAEKVLKALSRTASQLSIALIDANKMKDQFSEEEKRDYESIKSLVGILGNLQYKLNRIIKVSAEINSMNQILNDQGVELAEHILQAQEQFRNVRASINDYGFLSKNPDLAYLFEDQNDNDQNTIVKLSQNNT